MLIVILEAHPPPADSKFADVGGAYVTVFVRDGVSSAAVAAAKQLVVDTGWTVAGVRESYDVTRESYSDGDDHLEYFEQAQVDGIVGVFHQWPTDAPDHWDA